MENLRFPHGTGPLTTRTERSSGATGRSAATGLLAAPAVHELFQVRLEVAQQVPSFPSGKQFLGLGVQVDEGVEGVGCFAPRLEQRLARPQVQVAVQLRDRRGGRRARGAARVPNAGRPVLGRWRQVDVDGDVPRQRGQDVQVVLRQGGQAEHGQPLRPGDDGRPRSPLQPGEEPLLQPQVVAAAEPRRQRAPQRHCHASSGSSARQSRSRSHART